MDAILYQVEAVFSDRSVAAEYIDWLTGTGGRGHVGDVIRGGASGAQVIVWDGEAEHADETRTVVQYEFASRAEFDRYVREVAPGLRAEGLKRFPAERGVRFTRSTGTVVHRARA